MSDDNLSDAEQSDSGFRKRAENWTEAEKLALAEAVKARYDILFGKMGNKFSKKDVINAWREVLHEVNAVSLTTRDVPQIKEKWKNEKRRTKGLLTHNRKEKKKTGGGNAVVVNVDQAAEIISSTIPIQSVSGIEGGIDLSEDRSINSIALNPPKLQLKPPQLAPRPTPMSVSNELVLAETSITSAKANVPIDPPSHKLVLAGSSSNQREENIPIPVLKQKPQQTKLKPNYNLKSSRSYNFRKSPTEILLERQVELFEEQLACMKNIDVSLKRRNQIEEEKLKLKKEKLELLKQGSGGSTSVFSYYGLQ